MKKFTLIALLAAFVFSFAGTSLQAAVQIPSKETKKESKWEQRLEKKMAKFTEKMEKMNQNQAIDFSDPVDKWLWYAIFGWIGAIVFYSLGYFAFGFFWWIGYLLAAFASIAFLIWILKKLEVID